MTSAVRTRTRTVFGLAVEAATMDQVLERCAHACVDRRRLLIGVVNAAKVVHARHDAVLRTSLLQCDVLLADGQSVVWSSRLLGRPLPERVAGIDLFERLLEQADRDHRSVYLLGARPEVLAELVTRVERAYPGLVLAGARDGYFTDDEAGDVADAIRRSGADMVFVGMSSPKKEVFLAAHSDRLGVPVQHGVGGSFDVLAGITRRAPLRWQRAGLEWLYRVLQEPGRMWRRYLTTNLAFIALTARERVRPTAPYRDGVANRPHVVVVRRRPTRPVSRRRPQRTAAPARPGRDETPAARRA